MKLPHVNPVNMRSGFIHSSVTSAQCDARLHSAAQIILWVTTQSLWARELIRAHSSGHLHNCVGVHCTTESIGTLLSPTSVYGISSVVSGGTYTLMSANYSLSVQHSSLHPSLIFYECPTPCCSVRPSATSPSPLCICTCDSSIQYKMEVHHRDLVI